MIILPKNNDFSQGELPSGFLVVDKPFGWTSFDCVNKIAWTLKNGLGLKKKPKVGHAGTLDPYAMGLLLIAVGKYTKKLEELKGADKDYVAEIGFGIKSETYDLDGKVEFEEVDIDLSQEKVEEVLEKFRGEIEQLPPKFSALKIDGKRAYDLARQGKEFELKPRKVGINKLELMEVGEREIEGQKVPFIKIFATVSKGTYIRSLARDIGEEFNVPAALISLKRTRVGDFNLEGEVIKLSKETTFEQLQAGLVNFQ